MKKNKETAKRNKPNETVRIQYVPPNHIELTTFVTQLSHQLKACGKGEFDNEFMNGLTDFLLVTSKVYAKQLNKQTIWKGESKDNKTIVNEA